MTHREKILDALRNGVHRSRAIAEVTGINRESVQVRLAELVRERVVSSYRTLTGYQHGCEKFYRIRN